MKWALLAVGVGRAAGFLAQAGHVPAAWLIGPMIVAIGAAVSGFGQTLPRWMLAAPQGVIAVTIAQVFTLPVVGEVARDWLLIVIVVVATVVAAGTAGWLLARYSPISASDGSVGLVAGPHRVTMIALSTAEFRRRSAHRRQFISRYLRITLVVLTASSVTHIVQLHSAVVPPSAPGTQPFAAGAVRRNVHVLAVVAARCCGRYSRVPGAQFIFPLVGGAALHVTGLLTIDVPWWLLDVAYLTVGMDDRGLAYTRARSCCSSGASYRRCSSPRSCCSRCARYPACCSSYWSTSIRSRRISRRRRAVSIRFRSSRWGAGATWRSSWRFNRCGCSPSSPADRR